MLSFLQREDTNKKGASSRFEKPKGKNGACTGKDVSEIEFRGGVTVDLKELDDLNSAESYYYWYLEKGLLPTADLRERMAAHLQCDMQKLAHMKAGRVDKV